MGSCISLSRLTYKSKPDRDFFILICYKKRFGKKYRRSYGKRCKIIWKIIKIPKSMLMPDNKPYLIYIDIPPNVNCKYCTPIELIQFNSTTLFGELYDGSEHNFKFIIELSQEDIEEYIKHANTI